MKIPEKFHNSLTEAPFKQCNVCDKELEAADYMIEKAFSRDPETGGEQLIFEYAICMGCAQSMRQQLSRESLANIESFFMERAQSMRENGEFLEHHQIDSCMLSGKPLSECKEYQVYAHCRGGYLKPLEGMYMLSDEIMEEVQELISEQTRDELNRFRDDLLGGPPEWQELFSKDRVLLI